MTGATSWNLNRVLTNKWAKVVLFFLGLTPFLVLLWLTFVKHDLTANPIEYITHFTGNWALRFLLITLCITPLRMFLKRPVLTRFRRMLGLFAFFYACLHMLTWAALDQQFHADLMVADILKRKYITVGMAAFVLLLPLAITSTNGWTRRLGYKRWQKLHRIVYFVPALAVVHYYWLVKSDVRLPLMYGAFLLALLALRIPVWVQKKPGAARKRPRPAEARGTAS
ncbi:MAG TPA: protein-methionine-sulfoxide reductase heme-binding subunit MsrQ [Gammaproteobacteria bacterium]|nr:protein-methionine-sulfoxide reductase heme-binding subunit MsrQ [Gammaproteobacteria bacterium]